MMESIADEIKQLRRPFNAAVGPASMGLPLDRP
jgi:hypothetical protein